MGHAGVAGRPKRLYVCTGDVIGILGCKKSYAAEVIRKVNDEAVRRGKRAFPAGKANKYLFSDIYGIPMDDIEAVLEANQRGDGNGVL